MRFIMLLFATCIFNIATVKGQTKRVYKVAKSSLSFHSSAPQELISASSKDLKGVVDFEKGTFIFKIKMESFEGFNNPLQREHFNENYVESQLFPEATFEGKIIDPVSLDKNQISKVRTKGKFSIHGIQKECIIFVTIKFKDQQIELLSDFDIRLPDYAIKIPKVVNNKLASEVNIHLKAQLVPL